MGVKSKPSPPTTQFFDNLRNNLLILSHKCQVGAQNGFIRIFVPHITDTKKPVAGVFANDDEIEEHPKCDEHGVDIANEMSKV